VETGRGFAKIVELFPGKFDHCNIAIMERQEIAA
jgi:hypothetical protein